MATMTNITVQQVHSTWLPNAFRIQPPTNGENAFDNDHTRLYSPWYVPRTSFGAMFATVVAAIGNVPSSPSVHSTVATANVAHESAPIWNA